jgi:hypothetical protein
VAVEDRADGAETLRDGEEYGDRLGAHLEREDLAHREIGGAGPGRGEEEDDAPGDRLGQRGERALVEQVCGDREPDAGQDVRPGDHRLAADRVEQPADGERAGQVPGNPRATSAPASSAPASSGPATSSAPATSVQATVLPATGSP